LVIIRQALGQWGGGNNEPSKGESETYYYMPLMKSDDDGGIFIAFDSFVIMINLYNTS
jgi:hypothetical protein